MGPGIVLTIKFFSLVREALGTEALQLEIPGHVSSVSELKTYLVELHQASWQEILFQEHLVHAVNQKVVNPEAPIKDGDEVAFFPPMTGG